MKKCFSLLFIAASLLVVSCKKETVNAPGANTPVNNTPVVLKNLTHTTVNGDITITYNADRTPKQITRTSGAYTYTTVYTYSPGKVNYLISMGGKKDQIGEYTIMNGKATSYQWTYYDAFENPIATYNETYVYNAKGLLERHNFGGNIYTDYAYDNKDNLISKIYHNDQGIASSKVEYTYGNQKDLFPWLGYQRSFGNGFFLPAYSKYLPVSEKGTDLLTNQTTFENAFTYTLDADGYVIKGKGHSVMAAYNDYEWTNTFQ